MTKINGAFSIFFTLLAAFLMLGNAGGRPGNWAAAPGDNGFCSTCHFGSAAGSINLVGAPSAYTPGQSYNMTISLANSTALVGGFQIVATNGITNGLVGTFIPTAGTTLNDVSRLVQSTPKAFVGGTVNWNITWQAPNAGAPSNVQFYFAGNAANGNSSNDGGDFSFANSSSLIPLPVNLVSFEVKKDKDQIKLDWAVEEMENHSHFEIQHSLDASNFNAIAEVKFSDNQQNSRSNYSYIDESAEKGKTNYYRLKSIDFDGQFFYSKVENVRVDGDVNIALYPNPLPKGEQLNIDIKNFKSNKNYELRIINSNAQVVNSLQILDAQTLLNVNQISPGLYAIQLLRDGVPIWVERTILL